MAILQKSRKVEIILDVENIFGALGVLTAINTVVT